VARDDELSVRLEDRVAPAGVGRAEPGARRAARAEFSVERAVLAIARDGGAIVGVALTRPDRLHLSVRQMDDRLDVCITPEPSRNHDAAPAEPAVERPVRFEAHQGPALVWIRFVDVAHDV